MPGQACIVTSILPGDADAAAREIAELPPGTDPIELRADRLSAEDVAAVVAATQRPLIVTVRRVTDGGRFDGPEQTRRATLQAALDAGARWVDVEWGSEAASLADGPHSSRVILSDHGVPCEQDALERRVEELAASRAARLKIVAAAVRPSQVVAIRDLLRKRNDGRLCAFALGEPGALTRLLAPAWGSWGTYAAPAAGAETAPGQFSAAQLRDVFDVLSIRDTTRIVALAGSDILAGSPSPAMHNAAYRELDLDRVYLPLQARDWADVVVLSEALGFAGLAVTMPFKTAALGHVTRCDELSALAGALNTIVYEDTGPVGTNTDGPAAVHCLQAHGLDRGDRVDVLGAGGTGRAVAAALASRGYEPCLWSRDSGSAFGVSCRAHEERTPGAADWLINATPVRDETLIGPEVPARRGVLEAVYGPAPTALVRRARRAGLRVIDGLELLVAQAERQFESHTGRKPPPNLFAEVGQRHLDALG